MEKYMFGFSLSASCGIGSQHHVCHPGKRHAELQELEASIESQLRTGDAGDSEYWGAVLKRLHVSRLSPLNNPPPPLPPKNNPTGQQASHAACCLAEI